MSTIIEPFVYMIMENMGQRNVLPEWNNYTSDTWIGGDAEVFWGSGRSIRIDFNCFSPQTWWSHQEI